MLFSLAALALLALPRAADARFVVGGFGNDGLLSTDALHSPTGLDLGGQFTIASGPGSSSPLGIALNTSGNGAPAGTAYVVDSFETGGHRVQRFSPSGAFERLWGQDVIAPSFDENQRLLIDATAGSYTLTLAGETTAPIAFDADLGAIADALAGLPSVDNPANLDVFGPTADPRVKVVRFRGALAATDLPQLTADTSQLTGSVSIKTLVDGHTVPEDTGTGFEICTVPADCKRGADSAATANGGQLSVPRGIAVDQSNGHVYVTEGGNRRVSEFDPDGNFVRAFGWDVISSGAPNDNGTGFEVCDTTAPTPNAPTDCKQGAPGDNAGQFDSVFGTDIGYPAIGPSGDLWVTDAANRRLQQFSPTGQFIAAYGYDVIPPGHPGDAGVGLEACPASAAATPGDCRAGQTTGGGANPGQFADNNPTDLAFDAAGDLYAIDFRFDQAAHQRVVELDASSGYTSASDFAASTFDGFTTKGPTHVAASEGGARLSFSVVNDVTTDFENQIVELDPTAPGAPTDTSLVGAGLTLGTFSALLNGLAFDAAGDLYATTAASISPRRVLVLGDTQPPLPAATLDVGAITDTGAELSAGIDPNGGLVAGCVFQYSTDQSNWTDVPEPDCADLATDGVQEVSETLTGLDPNAHYFVRFRFGRPLDPGSTVTTPVDSFNTLSVPPLVSELGTIQVSDTSARLVGTVDPRNADSDYRFDYGTTPALGLSTPTAAIGGGTTPLVVSQQIESLQPDTDYYFELVATNDFGSTPSGQRTFHTRALPFPPANPPEGCPNQAIREAQGTTFLPDCRAYEMVTPPDKNQGGVPQGVLSGVVNAADGESVAFCTQTLFGEPPAQMTGICASYLSRRGPAGWQTTAPFPRYCRNDTATGAEGDARYLLSPDLERAAIYQPEFDGCAFPHPLVPGAPEPATNLYRMDLHAQPFAYDLLAPNPNGALPQSTAAPTAELAGASNDFAHLVFVSHSNQSPDSPPEADFLKLYDWHDGSAELVSRDPANQPFLTSSDLPGYTVVDAAGPAPSAVSEDGSRIYFQNPVNANAAGTTHAYGQGCQVGCELYLREGGTTTYPVSAGECSGGCGPSHSPALFAQATPDGANAFLVSCDALTDASTPFDTSFADCPGSIRRAVGGSGGNYTGEQAKLYRWDRDAPEDPRLIDLTADHEPADGLKPRYKGLIGASADGETAYFVAHGQLVSGQPTGAFLKLYRWRFNAGDPQLDYLGPYRSTQPSGEPPFLNSLTDTFLQGDANIASDRVRVTPDGRYLLITSTLRYDPAADHDSDTDLYRWDQAGGWLCISCQAPGAPSAGHAQSDFQESVFDLGTVPNNPALQSSEELSDATISPDGQRIVFTTPDALLPQDLNGESGCPARGGNLGQSEDPQMTYACQDIYQWNDGTLSLITPGTDDQAVVPIGTTEAGDVFFYTRQRLLGADLDDANDVYVARLGGGFPEPPPTGTPCAGDACQGPASSPPSDPASGSRDAGAGNSGRDRTPPVTSKRCKKGKKLKKGKCVKKKHSKKGRRR